MTSWRGMAPVQLVIILVGMVLMTSLLGIIALSVFRVEVPDELGTVCIASMTALGGLLAPNTGLLTGGGRHTRRVEAAGQAAAAAVMAAEAHPTDPADPRGMDLGVEARRGRHA